MADTETPYTETEALLAVMDSDYDRLDDVLAGMTEREVRDLADQALVLERRCRTRLDRLADEAATRELPEAVAAEVAQLGHTMGPAHRIGGLVRWVCTTCSAPMVAPLRPRAGLPSAWGAAQGEACPLNLSGEAVTSGDTPTTV